MKPQTKPFSCLLLFFGVFCCLPALPQAQAFDGYALYNDGGDNNAYLIDKDGNIAHSWSCSRPCNYTALLKPNGNLVRGAEASFTQINAPTVGGWVQEYDPLGNLVWEFEYNSGQHVTHHDIALMPNGNVLMIAYELINVQQELVPMGYTGPGNQKYATHIIEVQQNGQSGQIVWEWHIVDHMIQDVDTSLANYGTVSNHPELMNINVPAGWTGFPSDPDWFHCNGIDYNPDLDQIIISSRFLSEFFIIDHSTTTAEAASHSGGNSGMGGDLLYRWGNPSNYNSTFGVQRIPDAVHDPRWIPDDGRPNGGYIQFFNNAGNNGNSSVDAINPPRNGFNYTFNAAAGFGPNNVDWSHNTLASAWGQSSSDRMPNGNTFVNVSGFYMYEVDSANNTVWQYAQGPMKAFRYTCDDPGIIALLGPSPCAPVAIDDADLADIRIYPNPSTGVFKVSGLPDGASEVKLTVRDLYGKEILALRNAQALDLSAQADGVYFVTIQVDDGQAISQKISLLR